MLWLYRCDFSVSTDIFYIPLYDKKKYPKHVIIPRIISGAIFWCAIISVLPRILQKKKSCNYMYIILIERFS